VLLNLPIFVGTKASGGASAYPTVVLADSPVGYWQLGDASGPTAVDSATSPHNGTYVNGPTLGVTGPIAGKTAATFAAASSQDVAPSLLFNQALVTMEAWVQVSAAPAVLQNIAGCQDGLGSGTSEKQLMLGTDGKVYFYAYDGATKITSTPAAAIPFNQWVYVVGVADGVNAFVYVNGAQVGTVAMGGTFTGYTVPNFFIGAVGGAGAQNTAGYFNGSIGQVALYNHALTPTQISTHFAAR
jgi:hypothetical protein